MLNDLALVDAVLDDAWDAFVESSPHGTVFASAAFLRALSDRSLTYYCVRNGQVMAAVVLAQDDAGRGVARSDLGVYNGVLCRVTSGDVSDAAVVLEYFDVVQFVIAELARRHEFLDMQLSPSFTDIRPFLWFNYGTERPRFTVDVRYTSYLDITTLLDDEPAALQRARYLRRRELRKARSAEVTVREEDDPETCAELFRRTMMRQGVDVPSSKLAEMRGIMSSLTHAGRGRMFTVRDGGESPVGAVYMALDNRRAYYLFAGNDPSARSGPAGTALVWDSLRMLRAAGITELDFEGINSPRRGWFKLSFGGTIRPYYALTLDQRARSG